MADFFNKVLGELNKGINSVSENSKLFVEKTKLNTTIKDTESKKNKVAQQLGIMAYNLQMKGDISIEQFKDMCAEIEKYNKSIEDLKIQLDNLQESISNKTVSNEVSQSYICSCGHQNNPGAIFCAGCGSKLKKDGEDQ